MKKLILSLFTIAALSFAACGGDHHQHGDGADAKTHGEGKEFTSAYVCPMHCQGSGSEQAGTCPACGMDYVPLAEHTKDGHNH